MRFFVIICFVFAYSGILRGQPVTSEDNVLSLVGATETLKQDFHAAPIWRQGGVQINEKPKPLSDPTFSWAAGYFWNHPPIGTRASWPPPSKNFPAWTSDGQADADPNGDMITKIGNAMSPLSWSGKLNITARKMPSELAATIDKTDPRDYLSGSIISFPYVQLYGVFAISAKLPSGPGLWPAFWLLPADKTWPPEIDIMEVIGREPTTLYTTLHTGNKISLGHATRTGVDLSADFHEYAVDWGPDKIEWYFDRKLVFSQPTPPDLRKPCYILANLAVGQSKGWGGGADESTHFPATMEIAYIKVWQRPSYSEKQATGVLR